MLISFWSPVRDEYVSAIASLTAISGCTDFLCKVVLCENHVGAGNYGHCLFGDAYQRLRKEYDKYQSGYYERGDSFLKFLAKQTGKSLSHGRTLEIVKDYLFFLPLNQSLRNDIYEYGFDQELHEILEFAERHFDFLFMNTADSGNLSTKTILNLSETVVVCLPASEWIVDYFMEHYSGLIEKSVLLIHGEPDSGFYKRIRRKYALFRDRMMYLPITEELREYVREGRITDYWFQNEAMPRAKGKDTLQKLKYLSFQLLRRERKNGMLRYEEMRERFLSRRIDPFTHKYILPTARTIVAERENTEYDL